MYHHGCFLALVLTLTFSPTMTSIRNHCSSFLSSSCSRCLSHIGRLRHRPSRDEQHIFLSTCTIEGYIPPHLYDYIHLHFLHYYLCIFAQATISSDFLGLDAPLKPTKAPVNAMGGNAAMKTPTAPSVSMGAMGVGSGSGNSMNPMNNNNSFNGMGVGMAGSSSGGGRPMGGVAINNSGYSSSGMMNPLQTSKAGGGTSSSSSSGGNNSYDPFNSIDVMSGKSISSNNNNNNKSTSTYISSQQQQQQQQGKR